MEKYIPNKNDLTSKGIYTENIVSPYKKYAIMTTSIKIKPYRMYKFKLDSNFINIVDEKTIKIFTTPNNSRTSGYTQCYYKDKYLYIKSSERDNFTRNKYCNINILIIGETWHTQVLTKAKEYIDNLDNKEKLL